MKTAIFFIVALAVAIRADDILKEEDVNLVQDEKYFGELYSCMMDQAPCPEKMVIYRDTIPQYFQTKCETCSPKEKEYFDQILKVVSEKYPKEFKELTDKFSQNAPASPAPQSTQTPPVQQ